MNYTRKIASLIAVLVVVAASCVWARTVRQTYGYQDADNNVTFQKQSVNYETAGEHEQGQVITVGTNETLFAVSANIAGGEGPGLVLFQNEASGTNDVQVGIAAGSYFGAIPAGRGLVGWLDAGVTGLFFKAATTSAAFRIMIYER